MRILLVTNFFPPTNIIASHRTFSWARYLPEFGVEVEVLTPKREGTLPFDVSLLTIHYPLWAKENLQFSAKTNWLKELLKHTGIRAFRHYITSAFYHAAMKYSAHLVSKKIDAVIATYPLEDSIRIAYALSKRYGIPLIVDYRDLWLQNGYMDWKPVDRVIVRLLEDKINRHADLLTVATPGACEKLTRRYGHKVKTIYNGFWEKDTNSDYDKETKVQDGVITLCYCGSLYGGKRPIEWVFTLMEQDKSFRLRIAVLEQIDAEIVERHANNYHVSDQIELHVGLSSSVADDLERGSDILILLNLPEPRGNDVIPAKLYQHLAKNRFILGIGHKDGDVGRIITQLSAGVYISSKEELTGVRRTFESWHLEARGDIGFYSRRRQAEILAAEIINRFS